MFALGYNGYAQNWSRISAWVIFMNNWGRDFHDNNCKNCSELVELSGNGNAMNAINLTVIFLNSLFSCECDELSFNFLSKSYYFAVSYPFSPHQTQFVEKIILNIKPKTIRHQHSDTFIS